MDKDEWEKLVDQPIAEDGYGVLGPDGLMHVEAPDEPNCEDPHCSWPKCDCE